MMKQIHLADIAGRTVAGYESSSDGSQFLLSFTDGTFVLLRIEHGYEPGDETILEGYELDIFHFGDAQLMRIGVVTEHEIRDRRAERAELMKAQLLASKRVEYERLKLELGE